MRMTVQLGTSAIAHGGADLVRDQAADQAVCSPPQPLNNRSRFLAACRCVPVERPPVWLMRQAGRVLPEYCALKEKHSFVELVQTPELAAEVTLQPIHRFDL